MKAKITQFFDGLGQVFAIGASAIVLLAAIVTQSYCVVLWASAALAWAIKAKVTV